MPRATVRTYCHGLGDCHLVTLHRDGTAPYRILIDCGVIVGTPDATALMADVMENVIASSEGHVDLLVATHEHWDHVSGFLQAAKAFAKLNVGAVWMAWTEDPRDQDAEELARTKDHALKLLGNASLRLQMDSPDSTPLFQTLAEFFGPGFAARATTRGALEAVRNKNAANLRYCAPADPPVQVDGTDARIYVLGPPRDPALLKRLRPRKADKDQTYSLALAAFEAGAGTALDGAGALGPNNPFGTADGVRFEEARAMPFFQKHYFEGPDWRRIDADWLSDADELALALDNMTNNTSLVLAIELGQEDVLLFAADAQVGNWLSWNDCKWQVEDRLVTGPDLLARTIFYKVGHHGSFNATLKKDGVERMVNLQVAVVPVDHDMALAKKWGDMPLPELLTALKHATAERGWVLRTDQGLPTDIDPERAKATRLYIEVDF